jgi:hypothetical protein
MMDLIVLAVLIAGFYYWQDTLRCNELVLQHCRRICNEAGVQLLDDTVVRQRVWFRRNESGRIEFCRFYSFDYSDDSESRQSGYLVLLGRVIVETHMGTWRLQ